MSDAAGGDARLDPRQQIGRGLDRRDGVGQRRQPPFPLLDGAIESGFDDTARGDVRPFGAVERSEGELGRQHVDVGALCHVPRHSLSCLRLRCSHVLMVGTGRPKRRPSASRLSPSM